MIENIVTGAGGFIGSKLLQKLSPDTLRIAHEDIQSYRSISGGVIGPECKNFFFLSAYGNMAHHNSPSTLLKANILDVAYILDDFLDGKCESFVYVSSSSVNLPHQTPYSRMKRAGEEIVLAMPIAGCVVRPFSVTGVGEQKEHLIPTLIRSCLYGEAMNFVPDAIHDYVDVDDVVDGLVSLADKKATGIYEFGTCIPTTNQEILELVENITGKKANVTQVKNLREYDNSEWFCRKSSGFEPKKLLRTSIMEMVEDYGSK